MNDNALNNKRIAKNTFLLYIRMLFLMCVSLYTSRVVLAALGIEDFGIYNVVGGVVSMFSLISASLSSAISRFITYELGKNDTEKLNHVFSSAITIQVLIAIVIVIISEPIGLWFLNNKMTIGSDRIIAANYVFQFSLLTFCINLISVPYNATIIAHENMSAFAYISIIEALGKFFVALIISVSPIDKLIFYSLLICLISLIIRIIYLVYCKKHFYECKYQFIFDKELLKQMIRFAGWNFIGATAFVLKDQGINVLLNLFFGSVVNAARGIAVQVSSSIYGFVQNFITALSPQITKSYAQSDYMYMNSLIQKGSKFGFFLLLILTTPVIFETDTILSLWLKSVPDYTIVFVKIVLFTSLFDALSGPLQFAAHATGKIKYYQIIVGSVLLLSFPICYIALSCGATPISAFIIVLVLTIVAYILRLFILLKLFPFDLIGYIKNTLFRSIIILLVCYIPPFISCNYLEAGLSRLIFTVVLSVIFSTSIIFCFGCTRHERFVIIENIKSKIIK